jgi:hypothetical protein
MKLLQLLVLVFAITSCQVEDLGVDGGTGQAIDKEPVVLENPNAKGKVKSVAFTGDTTVTYTYLYDNAGNLSDSLWVSKDSQTTFFNISFDEMQLVTSLSTKAGFARSFVYNNSGLLAALEEQGINKNFAYTTSGLLSTLRYSSSTVRCFCLHVAW